MVAIISDCPMPREATPYSDWRYKELNLILKGALKFNGKTYIKSDFHLGYLVNEPLLTSDNSVDVSAIKSSFNQIDFIKSLPKEVTTIVALGLNCSKILTGIPALKDNVGEIMPCLFDKNLKVLPNYSTGYIQGDQGRLLQFATVFETALRNDLGIKIYKPKKATYTPVTELEQVDELVKYCQLTKIFAFDFETTGVGWYFEDIVPTMLSVSFQAGHSWIIPLYHKDSPLSPEQVTEVFQKLKPLFSDRTIQKVGHNLKFDLHWMVRYGVDIFDGDFFDTMLMAHLLDENNLVGLKDLAGRYFPYIAGYEKDLGDSKWSEIEIDILAQYAAIDTDLTFRFKVLFERMLKEEGLYTLYRSLTMRGFWGFFWAEHKGSFIDRKFIEDYLVKLDIHIEKQRQQLLAFKEVKKFSSHMVQSKTTKLIAELEERPKGAARIQKLKTGEEVIEHEVNFNSPSQMVDLLYTGAGFNFKPIKDDRGKPQFSTGKDIIKEIDHPFIALLLDYRTLTKMRSTYYQGILNLLDKDGFLHSSFLLHGTVTGRISSREPNLQNIPSRTYTSDEEVKAVIKSIKKFFIPRSPDRLILQLDYSQAELRFIAHRSGDKAMIEAYNNDVDLHRITGARIFDLDYLQFDKWDKDLQEKTRKGGKLANFGLVYNISSYGYITNLKDKWGIIIDAAEEKRHRNAVFGSFPGLKVWHRDCELRAARDGFLTTLFGRKRRFLNMHSRIESEVAKDIRDAINSPIQGSVGEIAVLGVGLLHQILPDFFILTSVHDSVISDIAIKDKEIIQEAIVEICENPPTQYFTGEVMKVKMKVDINLGPSWGELK